MLKQTKVSAPEALLLGEQVDALIETSVRYSELTVPSGRLFNAMGGVEENDLGDEDCPKWVVYIPRRQGQSLLNLAMENASAHLCFDMRIEGKPEMWLEVRNATKDLVLSQRVNSAKEAMEILALVEGAEA